MVPQRIPPVTADSDKIPSVTVVVLLAGALARPWVATRGHNFDFESWLIAADIFSHGGNIYAETSRYIYGPVWFLLLGILWPIARLFPDSALAFRYILPCFLTLADIGIFFVLRRKFGPIAAVLFFLNPISIVISGYQVQVDNIAILLGSWAMELWGDSPAPD